MDDKARIAYVHDFVAMIGHSTFVLFGNVYFAALNTDFTAS